MKLLCVTPTYLPAVRYGGPIWAAHGLCRALASRGHDVTVLTTSVDGPGDSPVPLDAPQDVDGVRVRYFRSRQLRRLYWSPALGRAVRDSVGRVDLVHCHSLFLWPPWFAARAARRAGRPYVVTPHGMLAPDLIRARGRWRKTAWIELLDRGNLERAAGVHVTSPNEAREVAATGLKVRDVLVIPFGADVRRDERPAVTRDDRRVLFLGRITWKKGLDRLIAAMAEVPGARLAIAGNDEEGHTEGLTQQVGALGLRDRVEFVGPAYGLAKQELLRTASVFVLPSRNENFAIAALEAMAAGVPVILTPEVGLSAAVARARAGLVAAGDAPSIAAAIRAVLSDGNERAAMGERARRLVREEFAWEVVAAQFERAFERILAAPWRRDA